MTPELKTQISDHLIEALNKENLHTREAARFLNMNPCYISMARNPKSFDAISKSAWERLEVWHNTREKISDFKIPDGEEIWQPKERSAEAPKKDKNVVIRNEKILETDEHSPENLDTQTSELSKEAQYELMATLKNTEEKLMKADEYIRFIEEKHSKEAARVKVALDIEINLVVNGQKVRIS